MDTTTEADTTVDSEITTIVEMTTKNEDTTRDGETSSGAMSSTMATSLASTSKPGNGLATPFLAKKKALVMVEDGVASSSEAAISTEEGETSGTSSVTTQDDASSATSVTTEGLGTSDAMMTSEATGTTHEAAMTTEENETTSEASSTTEDVETTSEDTTTTASPPLSDLTPAGNTFLHEWTKLRYGVFEQYGFPGDARYPAFYEESEGEFSPNHCTNVEIEGAELDIVSGSSNCQGPDSIELFGLTAL